jgi:hypothetical protein
LELTSRLALLACLQLNGTFDMFDMQEKHTAAERRPPERHGAMSPEKQFSAMHVRMERRSTMLGVLLLGFGVVVMTPACGSGSSGSGPGGSGGGPPNPDQPAECPATIDVPCMRYRIPLDGNPSTDVALRDKYIAAFGSACYMSAADTPTFDCFYQKWQDACADAVKIAEVYGAAPFDEGYTCQPVGNGDYTLQVGPDVANKITIHYQPAPRQTPLVEIDGVPTEVSGPYRNLVEPADVGPGNKFDRDSGMVDADGGSLEQRQWVLEVNRKKNGSQIHSDLAGFTWPCKGEDGGLTTCEEPDFLGDPDKKPLEYPATEAQVHHVVPVKDERCCPWGTNSYKNAAVISAQAQPVFHEQGPAGGRGEEAQRSGGVQSVMR